MEAIAACCVEPTRNAARDYIVITGGSMDSKLVRIGNSMGVRLPKTVLEEAGITGPLTITVELGAVVIRASDRPRAGWVESILKYGPPEIIDDPHPTRFDEDEWEWK